jgi:hypothetical protein
MKNYFDEHLKFSEATLHDEIKNNIYERLKDVFMNLINGLDFCIIKQRS